MADEEDDFGFGGMYENGTWRFDDMLGELVFVSLRPQHVTEEVKVAKQIITSKIEFREDIDLIEQQRFRRRYRRRVLAGDPDVITVQDIKDLALYTAPMSIMTAPLIEILHVATVERLIRAAIMYFQYYLQITDLMSYRILELDTKIRTDESEHVEDEYRNDLCDIRAILAKEYCIVILGGDDTRKFHHKGPNKKQKSLSDKDARFFEIFVRFLVQIVWIALGRVSFNTIEIEMNRLFKSEIYNSVEHTLKTGYISKMCELEKRVLLGQCLKKGSKKLNVRSPFANEVFCDREIDFRMMGLGCIDFREPRPSGRVLFFEAALLEPEDQLREHGISLGILGMTRTSFDTMLHPNPTATTASSASKKFSQSQNLLEKKSKLMSESKKTVKEIYPPLVLPPRSDKEIYYPPEFPTSIRRSGDGIRNKGQMRKWKDRLKRYHS